MKPIQRYGLTVTMGLALWLAAGCLPSVHPLYTGDDLSFDPGLTGAWQVGEETWAFTASSDGAYDLVITEKDGKTGRFKACLVQAGDSRFLDLFPAEKQCSDESGYYGMHFFKCHTFWRLQAPADGYTLECLDAKAVDEIVKADPAAVRHEQEGADLDQFIFTAPPKELQAFLLAHADRIWGDKPEPLVRKTEPAPEPPLPPTPAD